MNGPPESAATEARRWLRWAREDLTLAKHANADPEVVHRGACTWAHQAAEKALKALLVADDIDPPKVHDLVRLAEMMSPAIRREITDLDLAGLTRWAIAGRYPGDIDEASAEDAKTAIAIATSVMQVADAALIPGG
jgi:HEPN domain-containing protein